MDQNECILVLDVGGTTTSCAVVDSGLQIVGDVGVVDSEDSLPEQALMSKFSNVIKDLSDIAASHGLLVAAVSLGMPYPFDYEQGISYMQHKFKKLYGVNVRERLGKVHAFPMYFLNDADAFGYGVFYKHFISPPERLIAITLGTGVGSAQFERGELVDLEVWKIPHREGILEDYISAKVIAMLYRESTGTHKSAKEIADLAADGDKVARDVYGQFGKNLGAGLADTVGRLHPETFVFGGSITGSFPLFGSIAEKAYWRATGQKGVTFRPVEDPYLALRGAAAFARSRLVMA
jgi:glucokinase